jgi:carboxylesterase type B
MKMFAMYPGTTPEEIRAAIARTITDFMFLYGSIRAADYESAAGEPVYVERFMHVSPGAPGVMHGADGAYFRGDVRAGVIDRAVHYGADDEKLSEAMMERMAAFVKTFNPNTDQTSPPWPAWTTKQPQYLEIGEQMQVRPFQDQAIMNLYRKQLGQ